jgi:hypothetical protein
MNAATWGLAALGVRECWPEAKFLAILTLRRLSYFAFRVTNLFIEFTIQCSVYSGYRLDTGFLATWLFYR